MKIFLLLILFNFSAFAQSYIAGSIFRISPQKSSKDDHVNDYNNSGSGFSLQYGYVFRTFAPEVSYKVYRVDGADNQLSVQNKYLNVGFRLFLGFFNFKLGFAWNNSKGETQGGDIDYRSTNTTLSYGFGLRYSFEYLDKDWDLFSDLNIHSVEDTKNNQSKFIMQELEFGLRYYF